MPPRGLKTVAHQEHWVRLFTSHIGVGPEWDLAPMTGGNAAGAPHGCGNQRFALIFHSALSRPTDVHAA